jgi:hypothetical protein
MKTLICTISVTACLFFGLNSALADDPLPAPPKWIYEYYAACGSYNMGVYQLPTDPQLAITYFQKAEKLLELARADGGGMQVIPLLLAAEKGVLVAEDGKTSATEQAQEIEAARKSELAQKSYYVRATRSVVLRTK